MGECMRRDCIDRHCRMRGLEEQLEQYESDLKDSWVKNEELEAENARLAAVVEQFVALSVSAVPRHMDRNGKCWEKPNTYCQPTTKVYAVDAEAFDKAAVSASARDDDGAE